MYCVYTDSEVPEARGNLDHVIPLSLGGNDKFCVWSDAAFNSQLGSKIDGAVANDPLVMFARREADARGHSGTAPIPVFKQSEFNNQPAQVRFEKDALRVWDAKSRAYLEESEFVGKPIKSQLKLDRISSIKFAAKVALGGSYFVYGDEIRQAIDCSEVRRLMLLDINEAANDNAILGSNVMICDRFHPDTRNNTQAMMYKALCEFHQRSTFICVPHDDSVSFHVGVLGSHICSIICPAPGHRLPMDEDFHDLGHAILLAPGGFERLSFRELAVRCQQISKAASTDDP